MRVDSGSRGRAPRETIPPVLLGLRRQLTGSTLRATRSLLTTALAGNSIVPRSKRAWASCSLVGLLARKASCASLLRELPIDIQPRHKEAHDEGRAPTARGLQAIAVLDEFDDREDEASTHVQASPTCYRRGPGARGGGSQVTPQPDLISASPDPMNVGPTGRIQGPRCCSGRPQEGYGPSKEKSCAPFRPCKRTFARRLFPDPGWFQQQVHELATGRSRGICESAHAPRARVSLRATETARFPRWLHPPSPSSSRGP
jgi:hypothetical protein